MTLAKPLTAEEKERVDTFFRDYIIYSRTGSGEAFIKQIREAESAGCTKLREVNRRLRESLEKSKASLRFYDTHTSLLALDDIDAALAFSKENA